MRTLNISLFVTLLVFLTACGGSGPTPLSKDQKQRFAKVVVSTLQVTSVSQSVAERSAGRASTQDFLPLLGMNQFAQGSSLQPLANDPIYIPMEEALSQCEATFKSTNPGPEANNMQLSFSLSSASCPIRMTFAFKQYFSSEGYSMSVVSAYSVANDSFRKYSDVDAYSMNFVLDAKNLVQSGAGTIRGSGFVNSQEVGRINLTLSGTVALKDSEVSSQATMTFKFPDFEAVLDVSSTVTRDGKSEHKILLNGEEMTEKELQKLLESALDNPA